MVGGALASTPMSESLREHPEGGLGGGGCWGGTWAGQAEQQALRLTCSVGLLCFTCAYGFPTSSAFGTFVGGASKPLAASLPITVTLALCFPSCSLSIILT